jgi:hypothetical protein
MFGGLSSEHFWIDWPAGPEAPRGKRPRVAERCSSILVSSLWCAQVVVNDGRPPMNEISRSNVFSLLSANQRLLERLEAENARLRCSVVELTLEIQALRSSQEVDRSPVGATVNFLA